MPRSFTLLLIAVLGAFAITPCASAAENDRHVILISLDGLAPVAMLAFAGQERGRNLFGSANHDSLTIQRKFPGIPTIGAYTAGEIGPAATEPVVHSLSLTLGMIARRRDFDPDATAPLS